MCTSMLEPKQGKLLHRFHCQKLSLSNMLFVVVVVVALL